MLDRTSPIDQYAYLPVELRALCSELHSELSRHHLARCDPATIQPLERLDLARLESREISCDLVLHAPPESTHCAAICHRYSAARGSAVSRSGGTSAGRGPRGARRVAGWSRPAGRHRAIDRRGDEQAALA